MATQKQFEEKLKKLSADFEFFAHITSHDLRDPLRQARINSDELLANLNNEKEKEQLLSINGLVDEVLHKIAILRDFSYVANEKKNDAEVNLDDVVKAALEELKDKISASGAEIKIAKLPIVTGNEKHLKRLFQYLIDNAIKFCKISTKPKIAIDVKNGKKGFYEFTISDNGAGLDKVYRELVFVLFQRLDNTIKDGSFGMGLAFARKIVENHGGEIWYESDGENGTVFHFTLGK